MRLTSHATCAPIVDVRPGGILFLSRMEYTYGNSSSIRHIMETGKAGQTVWDTLHEGVLKEGAKDRSNFQATVLTKSPILVDFVVDERNKGGTQLKVAFPVSVPENQLRDYVIPDDDNHGETHGPITLVEVSLLIRETERNTVPFHYRTTRAALNWIASLNEEVAQNYKGLVAPWNPPVLTPLQALAINDYPFKW